MLKYWLSSLLVASFGFGSALSIANEADDKRPAVGEQAPEYSFQGSDEKSYSSKDMVGKQAVVIAWFPRAFTGGCTKECKSLKESGEMLRKFDVAYFTASTDDVKKNAEFAKSLELDYPILCDPTGENAKKFGVYNTERNAAARVTFIMGKDGKVLAVMDKVNAESHGSELVKMLDELKIERKKAKAAE
ncbi:MAG: peroxiredoxin family protein [Pirellula sp.]|jgi:peroxiredoxin Q/BCP|nr:peroxiredoxin family protein [Pirellula sp.]